MDKEKLIKDIWGSPTPAPSTQNAGKSRAEEIRQKASIARKDVRTEQRTVPEKIADFTGGKEIAQGLGQALAQPKLAKQLEDIQSSQATIQGDLINRIKQKKDKGEDVTRLEKALDLLNEDIGATGAGAERILNPNELTDKQVLGDALQLGTTIAGVSTLPGQVSKVGAAQSLKTGFIEGAKAGAKSGASFGALTGTSEALQDDESMKDVGMGAVKGGVIGGIGGGLLGGIMGGISGGLQGRALRKKVLEGQIKLGQKTPDTVSDFAKEKARDMAKTQGFVDEDIDFMMSMKPKDKVNAQKMIDLAEKAAKDKRVLERPIDIVGDSMVDRVKYLQGKNAASGKAVDTTAKALKGQLVDASPVREKTLALLEDVGVFANPDGTPNWSKSIFNKTPELEKKIMKTLSDLPAGNIDAYDLHNFKKSIDEVVDYGVSGEGLKGKSAAILKQIRNSADDVLDSTFESYNKANTDFKATKDVLEVVEELFGKKAGVSKERGGQLLRSVFSNNASRQRVMALIEQLDMVANKYGGNFKDNLLDQALFTEILEDVYGTQATTSLQGQVGRAVEGAQRITEGLRNPLKGAGDLLATTAEKLAGISPENKKKMLKSLLQ